MDLKLDDSMDLALSEDGDIALVSGVDETRQDAEALYNTQMGEWFLDANEGVDWLGVVFNGKKHLSGEEIDTELKRVSKSIAGSPRLVSYEATRNGSSYDVTLGLAVVGASGEESTIEVDVNVDDDGSDAQAFVLGA